jgi:hypothetical protein
MLSIEIYVVVFRSAGITLTFLGLAKVAIFPTNVDAEHLTATFAKPMLPAGLYSLILVKSKS